MYISNTCDVHTACIRILHVRFDKANLTSHLPKIEIGKGHTKYPIHITGTRSVKPIDVKDRPVKMVTYFFGVTLSRVTAPLTHLQIEKRYISVV